MTKASDRQVFVAIVAGLSLIPHENEAQQRHNARAARQSAEKLAEELGIDAEFFPGRSESFEDVRKDLEELKARLEQLQELATAPKKGVGR